MAEAVASFSPTAPKASVDKAAAMMVPEQAGPFTEQYAKSTVELTQHNVTAQAATLSAGVEALGPSAASVAVILRVPRTRPVSRRAARFLPCAWRWPSAATTGWCST